MASRITIGLVRLYQRTVSWLLPPVCRYRPSCSTYAIEAVQTYGLLRGLGLGLWRIMRCHPFTVGGDDPVRSPHTHAVSPISNEPANTELSDK